MAIDASICFTSVDPLLTQSHEITTLDQRVEWHLEHEKQCGCREDVPRTVRAELERRAAQAGNR